MNRPIARALLASAAVAAAIALAGCDADTITPLGGRAKAPISEKTLAEMATKNMDKESPILARIFKEESEMEIWKKNRDGEYALLKTFPICRWSGDLGPKKKEGDRQAPEGFYTITPGQMNPNSNYYLAFNTGFPNTYDRAMGYSGSELMVHGDCSSRGCYAMTDEQIQEIYALARESFFGGQKAFQLQAYPFRMTALNMAKHRNNPNFAFWKMLKEGYDNFNATHQEPKVAVCDRHYVFDAVPPDGSTKALSFNPRGACPAYQLDKTIADAVLDHRRDEQLKMAEYITEGVSTVPSRAGIDGGMNPVFAAKLTPSGEFDNNGRMFQLASKTVTPGTVPRTATLPAATAEAPVVSQPKSSEPSSEPTVVASVSSPRPAAEAKPAEAPPAKRPTTMARLIDKLLGRSKAESADKQAATRAGTDLAAKPKQQAVRTASAAPAAKPRDTAPTTAAEITNRPAAVPVQQTAKAEAPRAPDSEIRTAYSASPVSNNGLLSGAQPVVPVGTFNSLR